MHNDSKPLTPSFQEQERKTLARVWKLCIFILLTVVKCLKIQVMSIQYSGCLCIAWGFAILVISLQKPFYQVSFFPLKLN